MAGFATGIAQGLQTGIGLAQTEALREQQARAEAAREANYQSEAARRQALTEAEGRRADRQQQIDLLNYVQKRRAELASSLSPEGEITPEVQQELAGLNEYERRAHGDFFPQEKAAYGNAQQAAQQLASGQKQISDLDPKDVHNIVTQATGFPAHELIDQEGQPSRVKQALNDVQTGFQTLGKDQGVTLMRGLNGLYGDELHGYIGMHLPDGTEVKDVKFAPPVPQEGGAFVPMIQLTGQTQDGRTATRYVPLLSNQRSADDENLLHQTHLDQFVNHVQALDAMHALVNNNPDVRSAVEKAAKSDNGQAQQNLDVRRVTNTHPEQTVYLSPAQVTALRQRNQSLGIPQPTITTVVDPNTQQVMGSYVGGKGGLQFQASRPDQQAIDAATLAEKRAQLGTVGKREVSAIDPTTGQPVFGVVDLRTAQGTPVSGLSPQPRAASGGVGAATAAGLTPEAIEIAAQTFVQTGKMPPGFSRNVAAEGRVFDRVAQIQKDAGNDAEATVSQTIANQARVKAVGDLQKRNTLLQGAERTALANLDVLTNAVSKVDRSGSPLVNKLTQAFQSNVVQDPDLAAAKTALITFANEYARVVTGQTTGAAVTDAARKEQEQLLSLTDSPAAFKARINVMRQDMANRTQQYGAELRSTVEENKARKQGGLGGDAKIPSGRLQVFDPSGNPVGYVSPENKGKLPAGYTAR